MFLLAISLLNGCMRFEHVLAVSAEGEYVLDIRLLVDTRLLPAFGKDVDEFACGTHFIPEVESPGSSLDLVSSGYSSSGSAQSLECKYRLTGNIRSGLKSEVNLRMTSDENSDETFDLAQTISIERSGNSSYIFSVVNYVSQAVDEDPYERVRSRSCDETERSSITATVPVVVSSSVGDAGVTPVVWTECGRNLMHGFPFTRKFELEFRTRQTLWRRMLHRISVFLPGGEPTPESGAPP